MDAAKFEKTSLSKKHFYNDLRLFFDFQKKVIAQKAEMEFDK